MVSQTSHLTSLSLSHLSCDMRMTLISLRIALSVKCGNACDVLSTMPTWYIARVQILGFFVVMVVKMEEEEKEDDDKDMKKPIAMKGLN